MKNEIRAIEKKINELAAAVIPNDHLESFNALPLKSRIIGIKFFASMSNDTEITKLCEHAETIVH